MPLGGGAIHTIIEVHHMDLAVLYLGRVDAGAIDQDFVAVIEVGHHAVAAHRNHREFVGLEAAPFKEGAAIGICAVGGASWASEPCPADASAVK